jgi:predicted permease
MSLRSKIRTLFRRAQVDAEMNAEIEAHLELQAEKFRAEGMTAEEARFAALRQFGGVEQIKETAREQRGWVWLEQLLQDFRYAVRTLSKVPGFTAMVAISLALGIGACTAVFSLVDVILLRELSVKNPAELVRLEWREGEAGGHPRLVDANLGATLHFSKEVFHRLQLEHELLAGICAAAPLLANNVGIDHQAEVVIEGELVSGNYYDVLGVSAFRGRTLSANDDQPGAPLACVISHRYWLERFNGDFRAIGKSILINRAPATIVGVTPPGFRGVLMVGTGADITLPIAAADRVRRDRELVDKPEYWWLNLIGRRNPAHSKQQIEKGLLGVFQEGARLDVQKRNDRDLPRLLVTPGARPRSFFTDVRKRLLTPLIVTAVLALAAACSNVVNLLLARGSRRRRELAVRLALGASRGRIVRQLLIESMLLGGVGAAIGLLFSQWNLALLPLLFSNPYAGSGYVTWLNAETTRMGPTAFAFAAAIGLVASIAVGLVPAFRSTRVDLTAEFEGGEHCHGSRTLSRLSQILVVVQVAVALCLLTGAALCVQTLNNLHAVDLGFRRENLLLFATDAQGAGVDASQYANLPRRIAAQIGEIPGVRSVSYSGWPVLTGEGGPWTAPMVIAGKADQGEHAIWNPVGNDFFRTYEMPIVLGRGFDARDSDAGAKVAVVNESFARKFFHAENPLGRHLRLEDDREIVGVVRDAKLVVPDLRGQTSPLVFVPFGQSSRPLARFVVRTETEPATMIESVRKAVGGVVTDLPIVGMSSQEQQVEWRFSNERLSGGVTVFIGGLATILAAVGLYGLISYAVGRRTAEIGVRMALGAAPSQVIWMVFRESLSIVLVGLLVGEAGARALLRFAAATFFGVGPTDPTTYVGVALFLTAVASLACWFPARRAAKVDPMVALRRE